MIVTYAEMPGAEIALEVKYLTRKLEVDSEFSTHYSEHEYNYETREFDKVPPHFVTYADCSDTFFWGSSDAEEITAENIHILKETIDEVYELYKVRDAIESDPEYRRLYNEETSATYQAHVAECPMTKEDGSHSNSNGCSPWKPGPSEHSIYAYRFLNSISDLFCARVRGERPQGAAYKVRYPEELWPLFDAAGPEREVGFGNPRKPGE